jgi:hypothetical protein
MNNVPNRNFLHVQECLLCKTELRRIQMQVHFLVSAIHSLRIKVSAQQVHAPVVTEEHWLAMAGTVSTVASAATQAKSAMAATVAMA